MSFEAIYNELEKFTLGKVHGTVVRNYQVVFNSSTSCEIITENMTNLEIFTDYQQNWQGERIEFHYFSPNGRTNELTQMNSRVPSPLSRGTT